MRFFVKKGHKIMFENAKWIWINQEDNKDEYADFLIDLDLQSTKDTKLNISVDGNFEAYLNGKLCAFGSCADYPDEKYYDSFQLDEFCSLGRNQLKITVWHIGINSSVYFPASPGLLFTVTQSGKTILQSGENTLSRPNINYANGLCKIITGQLGPSYKYDATINNNEEYRPSVTVEKTDKLTSRAISPLKLLDRADITVENRENSILIDFGKETVGYLDLDFCSEKAQNIMIVFGEHLDGDGKVPRIIGTRDFSIEYVAAEGENRFFNAMRRIAGRYLEVFFEAPISVNYIGVKKVIYPLNYVRTEFADPLYQKIYDTCVYTLECCMHEHYEDCPWREQALYALDSRNQMLCGYVAFEEYRYARFNIVLLAKSLTGGLLRITSPTATDHPIPFFSLVFIQQVYEYIKFSGDRTVLNEVSNALDAIIQTFASRINENHLIPAFHAPAWNFFEWSDGNSNCPPLSPDVTRYDLCMNAMFIYVAPMYEEMRYSLNIPLDEMRSALKATLFNKDTGFFANSNSDTRCSVVGNTLAMLAGLGDKAFADKLIAERDTLTDNTLSMNCYLYDALLSIDESYKDYILKDIEDKYSYMLENGATTFWETIEGWHAFSDAGSLCHGWSALPAYYLKKCALNESV